MGIDDNLYDPYTYNAGWAGEDEGEEADPEKTPVPGVTFSRPVKDWKEAYELNKTSENCVICGKPTKEVALLTTKIRKCECVDALAKHS